MKLTCCEVTQTACEQGRKCPLRVRPGRPFETSAGLIVGGAYIPPKDTEYAEPIRRYRARSFFARFVAWLRS